MMPQEIYNNLVQLQRSTHNKRDNLLATGLLFALNRIAALEHHCKAAQFQVPELTLSSTPPVDTQSAKKNGGPISLIEDHAKARMCVEKIRAALNAYIDL